MERAALITDVQEMTDKFTIDLYNKKIKETRVTPEQP
jgi:hypothetical protein